MNLKKILLALTIAFGFAQHSFANKNVEYLHKVYAAEEEIMAENYAKALELYEASFALKKEKIFADDIFNALKCAVLLKDKKRSATLLEQLAKTGVGADFIKFHFENAFEWKGDFIKNICNKAELVKNEFGSKNEALNATLKTLYDEDQYYHTIWGEYSRANKIDIKKIDEDSVYKLMDDSDKRLSQSLKSIYDAGNTLSEFQLGVELIDGKSFKGMRYFQIIIMHNYQGFKTADTLFNAILKQQIENGDIKPINLTLLSDENSNKLKKDYGDAAFNIIWDGENLYFNKHVYGNTEWNKALDANRATLHLFTLEKQLKRIYFNRKQNTNAFNFRTAGYWGNPEIDLEMYEVYKP